MGKFELVQFESAEVLAQAAARDWLTSVAALSRAQPSRACGTAFSGGRIAEKFFDAIVSEVQQRKLMLLPMHFFWADERCVPPEHSDSNYRMMRARLLEPLKIPAVQVHRIKGELGPAAAARQASLEVSRVVSTALDFVFLGMGEDGHIASIFPGDSLEESPVEYYRAVFNAPKPPPERVTLAMHAIAAARNAWVLVSGSGKEESLGKSLSLGGKTPLGSILERRHFTRIFADTRPKSA